MEIVDRFGDWHHLTGLKDRERFWREGFDMIRTKDFRPQCIIEHVRLIRLDVAIVQARISYDQGIGLNGSDRIPLFRNSHFRAYKERRYLADIGAGHSPHFPELNAKKEITLAAQHALLGVRPAPDAETEE